MLRRKLSISLVFFIVLLQNLLKFKRFEYEFAKQFRKYIVINIQGNFNNLSSNRVS